jgi:DNA-binding CsgD family transcriptional regulator
MPQVSRGYYNLVSTRDHPSRTAPFHTAPLLSTLERVGCGGIARDHSGKVIDFNLSALHLLKRETGAINIETQDAISRAIDWLLKKVSTQLPADGASWATVPRNSGRPLAIYQLAIGPPPGGTILVLVDTDASLRPRPRTLRRMFGLTTAEMNLASGIASGRAPAELARQRHVSPATVRSQLASIFAKTHTRRQAELVALLARIALLP